MKSFLLILSMTLVCVFAASTVNAQNSEMEAISDTLNNYLNGHIKGDKNILGKAMHSKGKLSYIREGEYRKLEFDDYLSRMKLRDINDGVERIPYISNIDVSGNLAVARLVLDYSSILFTDYMTLLKINGEWKIVNKIAYSLREPNTAKPINSNIMGLHKPLEDYIEFMKTGNAGVLNKAAHSATNIMRVINGKHMGLALGDYISHSKTSAKNPVEQAKSEIECIDITGNVGIGKIVTTHAESIVVSYVSLIQINGEWKIINIASEQQNHILRKG